MPSAPWPARIASALSSLGQRAMGVRIDGAGQVAAQAPPAATVRVDGGGEARSVMDCGPGGCGPLGGFGGGGYGFGGASAAITPSLTRPVLDDIYTDQLMRKIVRMIVEDALSVRPTLSGETGELTPCIPWLEERGFFAEAERAMVYARQYGGGGVVCIIDDGRRADQEVDLLAIRDVVGFYAVPKWYLVPDGVGSSRVPAAWYGQRLGRPEHYYVTPTTGLGGNGGASAAAGAGVSGYKDLVKILAKSGTRFHRSRVIPWPYVDEMDLRLARWMAGWNGWGPGVIEAVLSPFLARRSGALRLAAIMNSVVVNTMTMTDLEHRQSTPDLGAAVAARLEFVKWCRDFMSDSLPIIATDPQNQFGSLSHNVSGIDKLVAAQRQYLLDVTEYPGVVLFGDSVGGLNGGDRGGEWKAYDRTVKTFNSRYVWTAGSFGGGMKQAVLLAMACPSGPTHGRMDRTVVADFPSILGESGEERANLRLKNAQARAQDRITLGLTPKAILRYDPTIRETYPGLDVDEGPLPVVTTPTAGLSVPEGTEPALDPATGEEAPPTTPGAVNSAIAGEGEQAAVGASTDAPPAALPADIHTEAEIAAALKMTRAATRKLLSGVAPFVEGKGARGGARWELSKVLAHLSAQARARVDAMRSC